MKVWINIGKSYLIPLDEKDESKVNLFGNVVDVNRYSAEVDFGQLGRLPIVVSVEAGEPELDIQDKIFGSLRDGARSLGDLLFDLAEFDVPTTVLGLLVAGKLVVNAGKIDIAPWG